MILSNSFLAMTTAISYYEPVFYGLPLLLPIVILLLIG
jgi:hypothetical protein